MSNWGSSRSSKRADSPSSSTMVICFRRRAHWPGVESRRRRRGSRSARIGSASSPYSSTPTIGGHLRRATGGARRWRSARRGRRRGRRHRRGRSGSRPSRGAGRLEAGVVGGEIGLAGDGDAAGLEERVEDLVRLLGVGLRATFSAFLRLEFRAFVGVGGTFGPPRVSRVFSEMFVRPLPTASSSWAIERSKMAASCSGASISTSSFQRDALGGGETLDRWYSRRMSTYGTVAAAGASALMPPA